ncbi:Guanosine-5'-triphosphate,3'-diphosphate pyrophosphatase [Pseudoalteromonas luteoviolacea B = ATCC 29581]|nr:Guanosine-5'-triphosphate,3'-diphosphate pyrophosphatase [Pseudoalteromonas luteoviolacea B = ATCC 29581]
MAQATPQNNVYAVIDLGSNSFHMLIAKYMANGIHTIGRVKRKVRLAAGLDEDNVLSVEAMERGWDCLSLFAERLQDLPAENIRIVATATLRLAKNVEVFKAKAESILGHSINIISGEDEACTIYKGVAHTSACLGKQLVIDIGGASTEVVIGKGFNALLYQSLDMGCVTYLERYFKRGQISEANFSKAIAAAKATLAPHADAFKGLGWELAIGASGTVQAIQEIQAAKGQTDILTLENLIEIHKDALLFDSVETMILPGLSEERRLVFVSGLAILIALFETLEIQSMGLAGGALREGVLYDMVPELQNKNIRQRTLDGLMTRYHVEVMQANRVFDLVMNFLKQLEQSWDLDLEQLEPITYAAACIHEIGLLIDFKQYQKHSAYILQNSGMPGYSKVEKQLIYTLVASHRLELDEDVVSSLNCYSQLGERLIRVFRLAVIFAMRRENDVLPEIAISTEQNDTLTLAIESQWLSDHPLMLAELTQEASSQEKFGKAITIKHI